MSEITAVIEKCHWCGGAGHDPDKCDWVTDKEVAAEKRGREAHVAYRPEEPRAWFVKDYADGWVYFDNEVDALREVSATGAMMYVGFHPSHLIAASTDAAQSGGGEITPHSFAQEYEFRGDGGDYVPTEGERTMIEDAICGYLAVLEEERNP
ncbi:hypothetical protein HAAEEKHM_00059 [Sinorhizobium phage AP-16-3]|nr:hypothetical protein HAAEEKHM_00059 [Sinorhizobium phage AP-16-3]